MQLCGLINKNTVVCVDIYLSHSILSCHQKLGGSGGYTVVHRGHNNIGRKACAKYQEQLFNNFMCMRTNIIIENLLFNTERYVVGKKSRCSTIWTDSKTLSMHQDRCSCYGPGLRPAVMVKAMFYIKHPAHVCWLKWASQMCLAKTADQKKSWSVSHQLRALIKVET